MSSSYQKINTAVIGFGIGQRHAEVFYKNKNCKLIYVSDLNSNLNETIKKKFPGIKIINSEKKNISIFKDKLVNLVCISSYDNFHKKHILECIKENKNFFIEKPLCLNLKELTVITNKLKKKPNLKFSTNFVLRFSPQFIELKKKN